MDFRVLVVFTFIFPFLLLSQAFHLIKDPAERQMYIKKGISSSPGNLFTVKRSSSSPEQQYADDYFDDDYYTYRFGKSIDGEEEEAACSEDMYWHARSFKCVPYDCPGGNQYRDKHSGDCLLKFYGSPNYHRDDLDDRHFRNHNRVRSSPPTKFRLPFGLTIKAG